MTLKLNSSWSKKWKVANDCQYKEKLVDSVQHYLLSPLDEPNPDANHIHVKGDLSHAPVVCSVKVDGRRIINRREFVQRIARATDIDINY